MSPDKSTTADHFISVRAEPGGEFTYTYDYTYSGEASSLLFTDLYVNGKKLG